MLGARMHYAVPSLLARSGNLGTFYTDIYLGNKPALRALLANLPFVFNRKLSLRLQGRACDGIPAQRVASFDGLGLSTFYLCRRARTAAELDRAYAATNRAFCERVRKRVDGADAIYGFNGAAVEIFLDAKEHGIKCILEQVSAPKRIENQLLREEAERWPGWEPGLSFGPDGGPLAKREEEEWKLADGVLCPSEFVSEGLQQCGADPAKNAVVPYGIETRLFPPKPKRAVGASLNVLFVGKVGLLKGVPYVLKALSMLKSKRVRCRLVGGVALDSRRFSEATGRAEIVGPVPRSQVAEFYRWADVFVFPSICEGSATVTYEALANGLPAITTANAGSVVRDGHEGFIVPIRDAEAIATRLEQFASDRELLAEMSSAAVERSREFTLERYGERLMQAITPLFTQKAEGSVLPSQYS